MDLDKASDTVWAYLERAAERQGVKPHEAYSELFQNDKKFRDMIAAYRRVFERAQAERRRVFNGRSK